MQPLNRLAAILPVSRVLVGADVTSKKRAFEEAGLLFESLHGLSRALITDMPFCPRAPGFHRPGARRGHSSRTHQRLASAHGSRAAAGAPHRL